LPLERVRQGEPYPPAPPERGEKNITFDAMERIARTLKISVFDLFREAESET
jgi:hypothetical protein